ncbi:MAG: uridine kinase [Calditrichaeota bacterium]|nr:MAG: uridine kinase [Calditrichota bacterium]
MQRKGILIGIAGASGSGKTLVAQTIYEALGSEKVVIIQEDSYYKNLSHLPLEERTKINFDHPDAFDHDLLIDHLQRLLRGEIIEHPIYDYTTHTRKDETKKVGPHQIIIVEGILILAIPELRELMNIKIFIDTPPDICLIRRLQRDIKERGRSVDSVLEQYQATVRPMYLQFVEPSKRYADIIIPHGGKNVIAIDIVKSKIEKLLREEI